MQIRSMCQRERDRVESNGMVKNVKFYICFSVVMFFLISRIIFFTENARGVSKLVLGLLI